MTTQDVMESIVEWSVVILIFAAIYGIYKFFKGPPRKKFEDLPLDGPMKVSITEKDTGNSINSKRIPCILEIDVTMSQRDWKAISQMGLMDHTIFEYPNTASLEPQPFAVKSLRDKTYIPFANVPDMKEAKERLISALHSLRAQIDEQRSGPKKETFEI